MRLLVLAAVVALVAAPARAADPVLGDWLVEAGTAKIKIAPCEASADRLCGLVTWLKTPKDAAGQPVRDTHNPDPKLQERPIWGLAMLRDFKSAGDGLWTGGKIYDPRSGKTYDSKLRLNPDGTLKVDGCVMMLCQAQKWTRVAER